VNIANYQLLSGIGLSERAVLKIVEHTRVRHYHAGEVLCKRGLVGEPWRYLLSGMAFFSSSEQGGRRDLIGVIGPGHWAGEAPVKDFQSSPLEILCMTDVRVMEVPFSFIQHAFDSELNFCRYVARMLNDRYLNQTEIVLMQRVPETLSRVALCLAVLGEKFNHAPRPFSRHSKTLGPVPRHQPLPLNQTEISSICGVSRSNLSQALKQFVHAELCQVQYSQVTLLRLDAWLEILKSYRNQKKDFGVDAFSALVKASTQEEIYATE